MSDEGLSRRGERDSRIEMQPRRTSFINSPLMSAEEGQDPLEVFYVRALEAVALLAKDPAPR